MKGLFIPYYADCGSKQLLQAVGVIGAIIMPHNNVSKFCSSQG